MGQALDAAPHSEFQCRPRHAASLDWAVRNFSPLRYRPGGIGNWSGHLPFAYDLVSALNPELIVELGTHYGESYFGLCQAVEDHGLSARCYAVDTWRGDEQSGLYNEGVYEEVEAYNRAHYGSFSVLLRTTFDDACMQFADASISLLHIDGLHTYEDVSHDFFQWLPKVAPGGVILLHDVMGRSPNFGVWKLWDELTQTYPGYVFYHSWGLGVIRIPGPLVPDGSLLHLLFESDPQMQTQLRQHYSLLAENLEYRYAAARTALDLKDHIYVKAYTRIDEGYTERHSVSALIRARRWERVSLPLPGGARGPIRMDFADRPAIIEIAEIQIRRSSDGEVLWQRTKGSVHDISVNSDMELLPGGSHIRYAALGFDPQMFLPDIPELGMGEPLMVDVWLSVDTELKPLAATNLRTDLSVENKVLQAELRQFEHETLRLESELNALKDGHRSLCNQLLVAEVERQQYRESMNSLEDSVAEVADERDWLAAKLAAANDDLARARHQVHVVQTEYRDLGAKENDLRQRVCELTDILRSEQERNRTLVQSWSWRITFPLRWIGRIARG